MILKLTNSTNEYTFELTDLNHGEKLFYNFQISTLEVEDGKYNMVITDDNDVVIAEEQVCIGYFNSETIQYQRAENVYINAPLEGNIQAEKNVEISEIETIIVPVDGFDAMEKVNVNAQPVYDNGYNQGSTDGYDEGYDAGDIDGYNRGYNEGETDQKAKLTGITITENGVFIREDGYNEITVDVQPKIDVVEYGIKFGRSSFAEVPEIFDFSNVTNMAQMFDNCGSLQTIPLMDTSNVTNMSFMFQGCGSLQTIPLLNTKNVTSMNGMFQNCGSLQTIPLINTSNVTDMTSMFESCVSLETIPELDTRNVTSMNGFLRHFYGMENLTSLPKFNVPKVTDMRSYFYYSQITMNNLTEVGGWENLKCNWNENTGLVCLPNLTYQSCINILNGLYNFVLNGETPTSSQGKLKVHQNFLTTVGDEISIGTDKGWTITA